MALTSTCGIAGHPDPTKIQRSHEQAAAQDHLQRVTLARCGVGTAPAALTDDQLVLLTADGVHDVLGHPALADAFVAQAASCAPQDAVDDATAAVIALS